MRKIAIMGAGSVTFARMLVNDLLFFEPFEDAEFRLMDIDPERLDFAENTLRLVNEVRKTNARFVVTTDRREALEGDDFAITMIQVGGLDATKTDFKVCRNHGLKLVIGDSMGDFADDIGGGRRNDGKRRALSHGNMFDFPFFCGRKKAGNDRPVRKRLKGERGDELLSGAGHNDSDFGFLLVQLACEVARFISCNAARYT